MHPYFELSSAEFNLPEKEERDIGVIHLLGVPVVARVMNCIVLGHGDGITVALTPESSVDQLRTAIKTHNGLSRWSKMDLYRSYNSNTETWHTVTDKDIHALGVLTEEEEIERAVAGYSVMDPSLQLGSVELNFPRAPRDRQDNIVHVLAVVPASALGRFTRSLRAFFNVNFGNRTSQTDSIRRSNKKDKQGLREA